MKNLLSISMLCLIVHISIAQSSDYYNRMNHVFGAIDKSKVTTGLLKEFGVRLNHVENYSGSINNTNWVDETQWRSLYHSLYSMRVGTATNMTAPESIYAHLENQQASNPNVVLIAAEYYSYQEYKSNAYSNGDVTVSNDRIYDVQGRNPYVTKTAFAVTPMKYHLKGNSFSFKLQSNMIYTNSTKSLSSVQIDFDNGQGYQTVSINSTKNVTYSSNGEKELKVKFVYSGGPTLYSHSKLYIDYVPSTSNLRFDGIGVTTRVITGAAYLGATAVGDITIETAGTDGVLDKPLIVVEGFDPYDTFNYIDLIDDENNGGLNREINAATGLTLNQAIENEDYDLVFVNYRNGTDFIQRNAYMVEAVIEWVNSHKTGTEKNVVLGMSMGGLVARYALRHMETTGRTHDTKLYISHDAPHQGANVPLAYQALVRHLVGESIRLPVFLSLFNVNIVNLEGALPELEEGFEILQSPAAQQMLIYQLQGTGSGVSIDNTTLHGSFLTEYKNLGYPTQGGIKNIAISNGSECGTSLDFDPYAILANVDVNVDIPYLVHRFFLTIINSLSVNSIKVATSFLSLDTDVNADFVMRALPDRSSKQIYKGRLYIKKTVLGLINIEESLINQKTLNSSSTMLSLDNVGGGIYDINQFITLPANLADFILETRFNFVPTYSSLDIGSGNQSILSSDLLRSYSPVSPPNSPKDTPFDNFFTNPTISQNHIQFTLENGLWLLEELRNNHAFYTCASSCTDRLDFSIQGSSRVCTSNSTISLLNIPTGVNVSWTATPATLFHSSTRSGTGTTAIVRAANSSSGGLGQVNFTIQGDCGNIVVSTEQISIGVPSWDPAIQFENGAVGESWYLCTTHSGNRYTFSPKNDISTHQFRIKTTSGTVLYTSSVRSGTTGSINYNPGVGFYIFEIRGTNNCGTSNWSGSFVEFRNCTGGGFEMFSAFPNPTSVGHLIIREEIVDGKIKSEANTTKTQDSQLATTVHLYDRYYNEIKSLVFTGNQHQINTSDLKPGIYFLIIQKKDKSEVKRIIVE